MTLNALKPSIREKKRYICFRVDKDYSLVEVQEMVLSRIKRWMGEKYFAIGRVYFMTKFFENNKGIISCNFGQLVDVKTGLSLVENVDIDVFYVSGSLKKALEKLKSYV